MKNKKHALSRVEGAKPKLIRYIRQLCLSLFLLIFSIGCENSSQNTLQKQIQTLRAEKLKLKNQFELTRDQNKKLQDQLQVLSGLPPEVKGQKVYDLQKIKITRYTNFYDRDKDGKKEKLIVYLQPIDETGDIIKATGSVDIQLWDLNKNKDQQALLCKWHVKADELKNMWFATLITINYRLPFDISETVVNFDEPLTVKVTFTDYLTGKVFKEQKVIKP